MEATSRLSPTVDPPILVPHQATFAAFRGSEARTRAVARHCPLEPWVAVGSHKFFLFASVPERLRAHAMPWVPTAHRTPPHNQHCAITVI